ncbi:HAD family hydrolase [Agarivorans gilvus]|jgi:HAD superfamily hydrolase (TIGR01484 family)|uniref:Haloacid dehalogenase n=1 Tax=Agarivorans gilvus TaxID=680279 RepID=A0ABQ1I4D1_9ALTE|nr:HAD-IIB family hydrolase [Agarivorans gilvus]GGB15443.1 haloacid dehalogenase [Agarivorans gilvus]
MPITSSQKIQQPLALPQRFPFKPRVLFSDVDDTLTWQGELPGVAFQALLTLRDAGISVVPVTGASAGWCDCLLKILPIRYIVGENGAFWMEQHARGYTQLHLLKPQLQMQQQQQQLKDIATQLNQQFPEIHFAQDQAYRISDVALDIAQAAQVDITRAKAATGWLKSQNVQAQLSSIHINLWMGQHNKASGALAWLKAKNIKLDEALFIGDSGNDEAMFQQFKPSVGVANVQPFIADLSHAPTYITEKSGGWGFAQLASSLLEHH